MVNNVLFSCRLLAQKLPSLDLICLRESLVHNREHMFCSCYKVRSAWQWSNMDIIMAMFQICRQEDECMFILEIFL